MRGGNCRTCSMCLCTRWDTACSGCPNKENISWKVCRIVNRQGYQEGWPDAVKVASKGYILATQKEEYQAAIAKSYRNPQSDKYFVWQVDYNTSGAFMSWLRLYNGDFVRMLRGRC